MHQSHLPQIFSWLYPHICNTYTCSLPFIGSISWISIRFVIQDHGKLALLVTCHPGGKIIRLLMYFVCA